MEKDKSVAVLDVYVHGINNKYEILVHCRSTFSRAFPMIMITTIT